MVDEIVVGIPSCCGGGCAGAVVPGAVCLGGTEGMGACGWSRWWRGVLLPPLWRAGVVSVSVCMYRCVVRARQWDYGCIACMAERPSSGRMILPAVWTVG